MKQLIDTELEIAAFGIATVLILETIALIKGVDGVMFGSAMTAVGVIMGWVFKGFSTRKK